jgi:organic radical activating enzyme
MDHDPSKNFYCSQKFTWLGIDLEKKLSYSCCSAKSSNIDVSWLKQNPGNLFNTPELQKDRIDLLDNKPVSSCNTACWIPESKGMQSRRMSMKSYIKTHTEISTTTPESLNIILGSMCNLTCSYCCKEYSTAWARDILNNGIYLDETRYKLTTNDRLLLKFSQREHKEFDGYNTLIDEISNLGYVKKIFITGGEPFLYNGFIELLNNLHTADTVLFYTGLGVDSKRLQKQLKKITNIDNIEIRVSAENINKFYEFNRYGNSYDNFVNNLAEIKKQGFNLSFSSVLSNLTVFGIGDFCQQFPENYKDYQLCNDPNYLSINVLDDASKEIAVQSIKNSDIVNKDEILTSILQPCTDQQRQKLSIYLNEFVNRRHDLSLDIFPKSMLKWLNII